MNPRAPARRSLAAPAIVVFLALAVNLPALFPGFLQDDHPIVENNPLLNDLSGLERLLGRAYWAVGDRPLPDLWRPVTMASFALVRAVGGSGAFGDRLVNLLLHAGIALLILMLGRRLFATRFGPPDGGAAPLLDPAAAAALLFAVHAVHTEVLGFVVGRAELLATAGTLLCVLLFLRARDRDEGGGALYAASIGCFALGFLSKENAVVAPALLVLADLLVVRRRPAWRIHLSAGAALAILLALRRLVIGRIGSEGLVHFVDNPIAHMPFAAGRRLAIEVLGRYARLLVAPLRLSADYSYDALPATSGWLDPGFLFGAAAAAACAAGLMLSWRRRSETAFPLAWLIVALLPVANLLFPIGTIMAERLLYLPSAGFCLLAAAGYGALSAAMGGSPPGRAARLAPIALLIPVLLLGARSQWRLRDWRDDYTLWKSALDVAPRSVKVQFNFGSACEERGEDESAAAAYARALALWPEFADAHYNLAGVLARRRDWTAAVTHYRAALDAQPGNVKYLVNLGHALNGAGKPDEARPLLQRAIELDPASDQAYTTLGAAELLRGDAPAAARAYAEAVRLVPGSAGYWTNLGLARERAGEPAAAVDAYRRGVALAPGDPVTHNRLGGVLEAAGRPQEAAAEYRAAISLAPGVPIPLRNLGLLLYRTGDRKGALGALEQAESLDPRGEVMDAGARRILEELRR